VALEQCCNAARQRPRPGRGGALTRPGAIGAPGAKYVTLQKFNNYALYGDIQYFYFAEVQVLADGEDR
jgi:hypothetical protein